MRLQQKACLLYMVIVAVVMSIYSMFLMHLTQSFRPSPGAETYAGGPDPRSHAGHAAQAEPAQCRCTPESMAGLDSRQEVVIGLSFPYKYFNSNHWFHISEYYVSRHTHVAPKLPRHATVYIVAPHELFVPNLIPMTFFLLLLAFTDGTTRTAEVLPRRALAQLAVAGDVLALDNNGVESYVYNSSLPAFQRTRKYQPGERQAEREGLIRVLEEGSGREAGGRKGGKGERKATNEASKAGLEATGSRDADAGVNARGRVRETGDGGGSGKQKRLRARQLRQQDGAGRDSSAASGSSSLGGCDDVGNRLHRWAPPEGGSAWEAVEKVPVGRSLPAVGQLHTRGTHYRGGDGDSSKRSRVGPLLGEPHVEINAAAATAATATVANSQVTDRSVSKDARALGARMERGSAIRVANPPPRLAEAGAGVPAASESKVRRRDEEMQAGLEQEDMDKDTFSHGHDDQNDTAERFAAAAGGEAGVGDFYLPSTLAAQHEHQYQHAKTKPCACARYIGEFGAAPVERGYWFREEKVENSRARIDALCGDIYRHRREGRSAEAGLGDVGGMPGRGQRRLVIYQRNKDRRLLELDENVAVFRELLGPEWDVVPIVHDNAHEPCWLYSQLMDADMLLTPHGFQSMLLLFLPPGATILEVFPYKYWKEGYAPLATEWGVRHEHIMSRPVSWEKRLALFFVPLERCMKSIHCRKWSRAADVRLEEHHLRQIVKAAKQASKRKKDFLLPPDPL